MECLKRSHLAVLLIVAVSGLFVPRALAGPCDEAMTQLEINDCAHGQFLKADRKLNELWPSARRGADRMGAGDALLDSQRKWIAFRDSACTAEVAPYEGGSIQPSVWSFCLARQTKRRIKDLKMFIK